MRRLSRLAPVFLLAGCAATKAAEPPLALSPDAVVLTIPENPPAGSEACGLAAVEQFALAGGAPLTFEGRAEIQNELLHCGAVRAETVTVALERTGRRFSVYHGGWGCLRREIDAGRPVLVLVGGIGSGEGEYLLVIGYDSTAKLVVCRNASGENLFLPFERFLSLWHRKRELAISPSDQTVVDLDLLEYAGVSSPEPIPVSEEEVPGRSPTFSEVVKLAFQGTIFVLGAIVVVPVIIALLALAGGTRQPPASN